MAFAGAISLGMAPTSILFEHLEPAMGLEPTIRCTWPLQSNAVNSAGVVMYQRVRSKQMVVDQQLAWINDFAVNEKSMTEIKGRKHASHHLNNV